VEEEEEKEEDVDENVNMVDVPYIGIQVIQFFPKNGWYYGSVSAIVELPKIMYMASSEKISVRNPPNITGTDRPYWIVLSLTQPTTRAMQ
jgi:hypothetical protein